jgi:two-component system, LuxR family, response regulator FixJ
MTPPDEIFILDDDPSLGGLLTYLLRYEGYQATYFRDQDSFVRVARSRPPACILFDVFIPPRSGLEILKALDARNYAAPIVMISGKASVPLAVEAVKLGAFDVIEKPFDPDALCARLGETISAWRAERNSATHVPAEFSGRRQLTPRERQVLSEIAAASSNKEAAARLGLSPRTVEVHRAHIMMKLGTKSTAELIRLVTSNSKTS